MPDSRPPCLLHHLQFHAAILVDRPVAMLQRCSCRQPCPKAPAAPHLAVLASREASVRRCRSYPRLGCSAARALLPGTGMKGAFTS